MALVVPTMPIPHRPETDLEQLRRLQRHDFAVKIRALWGCKEENHQICVLTRKGGHHPLPELIIEEWIEAVCAGLATIQQPPIDALPSWLQTDIRNKGLVMPRDRRVGFSLPMLAEIASQTESSSGSSGDSSVDADWKPAIIMASGLEWLGKRGIREIGKVYFR
ncbi:hypothetical protein M422DRAFT_786439 [Sphaerobolus stellatus SS14]|uniref:Uncharacterized protein n=1 Tax=Sphaerobolus stellatus (strain SS14) TaxID=990650 RepID=A0A0C9T143_SPHS4|nr:hypothetical protein M422DRAFT_786439 [Sphaerobolus stellatus SS14]